MRLEAILHCKLTNIAANLSAGDCSLGIRNASGPWSCVHARTESGLTDIRALIVLLAMYLDRLYLNSG